MKKSDIANIIMFFVLLFILVLLVCASTYLKVTFNKPTDNDVQYFNLYKSNADSITLIYQYQLKNLNDTCFSILFPYKNEIVEFVATFIDSSKNESDMSEKVIVDLKKPEKPQFNIKK